MEKATVTTCWKYYIFYKQLSTSLVSCLAKNIGLHSPSTEQTCMVLE